MGYQIDLNSDLGESFGDFKVGNDAALLPLLTTANVACGWHGGDPVVMEKTVRAAKEYGIAVGAHPGYPDLMGFGRRDMKLTPAQIKAYIKYQVGALDAFVRSSGMKLQHVKAHGALGNKAMVDEMTANAVCDAVLEYDPELMVFGHANSLFLEIAKDKGLRTVSEIYMDRAYLDNSMLVPRSQKGAMIEDVNVAIERSVRLITTGKVLSITGKELTMQADSLCVHGDTPQALEYLITLRKALEEKGIAIRGLQR
ncbi:MAG: LamB/YcsF family protein [Lachnospiraceae bacterium]|nr:LamB/YcsF family protein [Lachnospiraceae bacterium]MBR0154152.1 LamB/YcsF family protein [Lachnospiraceae bacterium]